jgi:rhamnosyltransferase subunit B
MRFLLSTIGTMGDAIPFVEIAAELRRRGHETLLLTNACFQEFAERRGIAFHAIGTREEYLRLAQDKELYHPLRGVKEMAEQWVLPGMRRTLEYLAANRPSGGTVLVGAPMTAGLRIAQELYGLAFHSIVLSPFMLPSVYHAPISPGFALPQWAPRPFKQAFKAFADKGLDGVLRAGINAIRAEYGLRPLATAVRSWWLSPTSVIGPFPRWFAPVQPDWPAAVSLTGFLPPPAGADGLPPELVSFLAQDNSRLAIVTMGSILTGNENVVQRIVEDCLRGGFKVLLLAASPRIEPLPPSPRFRQVAFVPLAPLLVQASLIVHHAGIGTAAAALAAGIPQLLRPHGHDQFDNAARLVRLGVAKVVARDRLPIEPFLADPQVATACRRAQALCASDSGMDRLCRLLESGRREGDAKA